MTQMTTGQNSYICQEDSEYPVADSYIYLQEYIVNRQEEAINIPKVGFKHTEETKEKIRELTRIAMASPEVQKKIKGREFSEEHIKELKEAKRRFYKNGGVSNFKGRHFYREENSFFGEHHSEKTKMHWSEIRKGRIPCNKGKVGKRGEGTSNWKGGITPENKRIRNNMETRLWREAVFTRDDWTCQKTGIRGGKITAHHVQNFAQIPELRFATNNGITLSEEKHIEFHKIFGKKDNNKEQMEEFINS